MEFKKCNRCGAFFMSNDNICCNCEIKDKQDISKLNNIINSNTPINSIEELSFSSGIKIDNINRLISNNNFPDLEIKL